MYKILLIGSDINAYYMARSYHELYHNKVDVIAYERIRFTEFSSFMNITYDERCKDSKLFSQMLVEYAQKNYKDKVILIPCHDVYVRLVVENKKELDKYYLFNCPSEKIMNNLLIKSNFYKEYKDMGLDFPNTYFYDCTKKLSIHSGFMYPLIIKPSNGVIYNKVHFEGQAKVYKVDDLESAKDIIDKIKKSGYNDELIIQEYITGDDSLLFDSVFYVSKAKRPQLATFAQIGLQEHGPTAIGNCTVLINGYNEFGGTEEITKKMKKFLERIGYTGFCEFDLKYDKRDGKFKVLEINPRQARSSYYLTATGNNLVKYLIDDLYDNKEKEFKLISDRHLLTMVPLDIINKYIENDGFKKEAIRLYKNKNWSDPLNYKGEKGMMHKMYLILRKINYRKKYKLYKW